MVLVSFSSQESMADLTAEISTIKMVIDSFVDEPSVVFLVSDAFSHESHIEGLLKASDFSEEILMLACDIILIPSLAPEVPHILLSAMSHGKVVVSSETGGKSEFITSEKVGILIPETRPKLFALAITTWLRKLVGSKELRSLIASAAREEVSVRFDVELLSTCLMKVLCSSTQSLLRSIRSMPFELAIENILQANVAYSRRQNLDQLTLQFQDLRSIQWSNRLTPFSSFSRERTYHVDVVWPSIFMKLFGFSSGFLSRNLIFVQFVWRITRPVDVDYMIFVHLLDEEVSDLNI
jgi:hypothetical protein